MATWLFRPPTVDEGPAGGGPLFNRYELARGITVLETAGVYSSLRFPTQDEIAAATNAYLGGHEYVVSDAIKTALIAANIGVTAGNFTGYVQSGYGYGRYGDGPYGG